MEVAPEEPSGRKRNRSGPCARATAECLSVCEEFRSLLRAKSKKKESSELTVETPRTINCEIIGQVSGKLDAP